MNIKKLQKKLAKAEEEIKILETNLRDSLGKKSNGSAEIDLAKTQRRITFLQNDIHLLKRALDK